MPIVDLARKFDITPRCQLCSPTRGEDGKENEVTNWKLELFYYLRSSPFQGLAFGRLEPYDGKLSRTVLRGERGGNAPDLPGAVS